MARLLNYSRVLCQFLDNNSVDILYKKAYCRCEVDGDYVIFLSHDVESNRYREQYRIHYADWGDPTGASAVDVKAEIDKIIQSYAAGPGKYGAFFDTTIQTNLGATSENIIEFNSTYESDGVSVVSGSQITVTEDAVYNVQFSAQFEKTSGPEAVVQIWLKKNGNNIDDSNTEFHIHHNNGTYVPAWNYVLSLNAGDYVELAWHSSDTTVQILSQGGFTTPTRPDIPGIIVTITQVMSVVVGGGGGGGGGGTVTSVGLTIGSTGTDANVSGSPVTGAGSFTLNLPTASATNRGLLSSADWTAFNSINKRILSFIATY